MIQAQNFSDDSLSHEANDVLYVLSRFKSGQCYPSRNQLQRVTGLLLTQISDALIELETNGLIEIIPKASPLGTDLYRFGIITYH